MAETPIKEFYALKQNVNDSNKLPNLLFIFISIKVYLGIAVGNIFQIVSDFIRQMAPGIKKLLGAVQSFFTKDANLTKGVKKVWQDDRSTWATYDKVSLANTTGDGFSRVTKPDTVNVGLTVPEGSALTPVSSAIDRTTSLQMPQNLGGSMDDAASTVITN